MPPNLNKSYFYSSSTFAELTGLWRALSICQDQVARVDIDAGQYTEVLTPVNKASTNPFLQIFVSRYEGRKDWDFLSVHMPILSNSLL